MGDRNARARCAILPYGMRPPPGSDSDSRGFDSLFEETILHLESGIAHIVALSGAVSALLALGGLLLGSRALDKSRSSQAA